jgi:hypothetical protein
VLANRETTRLEPEHADDVARGVAEEKLLARLHTEDEL